MKTPAALETLCINTIRTLSMDAIQKANSGHPGLPMGAAAPAFVLWHRFLRHNPADPAWPNRDRFVLSAGHGSMLLYSLLHLTGYDLPLEELKNFRQWGSRTPGHPEFGHTAGVETTTGPLGQGFANAVGMAMAEAHLAAVYNRPGHEIIDHYTYALVSDGDLMEGVAAEAASLAGHLRLGKLIFLYDDNHISIEGDTAITFTEDRMARFAACGWHVQTVSDGNDTEAIAHAISAAQAESSKPSIIAVRTVIGFGSPSKQGTPSVHGEPLGEDEIRRTKEALGWPSQEPFFIPEEALEQFRQAVKQGENRQAEWQEKFAAYAKAFPEPAAELQRRWRGELPQNWQAAIPEFPADPKGMATRAAGGKVLNAIAAQVPELIGGSADLGPSTKTLIEGSEDFQPGTYAGRNLRFGVREHAMASICNGMSLYGGLRPYCSTFLVFSDYMRPAIRLAALMRQPVIYVFTHDSIGLGEDGPTHQPVEHLAALRSIPGLMVLRPADAAETAAAWQVALSHTTGPVALVLTRQSVPTLDRSQLASADGTTRGGYILMKENAEHPELILIASGSEVHPTLQAAELLRDEFAVRVVSMPSQELFQQQDEAYREQILPAAVQKRVVVEAGIAQSWGPFLGAGRTVTIDSRFGASAPAARLMQEYGFSAENIARVARGE